MLSFPLLQTISRPLNWLAAQLGDTSTWRYYGYNSQTGKYVTNDTIQGGQGKWLYTEIKKTLSVRANAPKPDTLFAIPLSQGWNLIGSPFAFPVFWENSLVRYNGNIVRLYDYAAQQLVRRQWFHYVDTTEDRINDGQYISNRDVLLADTTQLIPWNGYWVYAEKSGVELLLNPSPTLPATAVVGKKEVQQIRTVDNTFDCRLRQCYRQLNHHRRIPRCTRYPTINSIPRNRPQLSNGPCCRHTFTGHGREAAKRSSPRTLRIMREQYV